MKNVYDGVVILDKKGEAEVDLSDWFSALNKDYRISLLLLVLLDQISTLQRKYMKLVQITLIPLIISTTIIAVSQLNFSVIKTLLLLYSYNLIIWV